MTIQKVSETHIISLQATPFTMNVIPGTIQYLGWKFSLSMFPSIFTIKNLTLKGAFANVSDNINTFLMLNNEANYSPLYAVEIQPLNSFSSSQQGGVSIFNLNDILVNKNCMWANNPPVTISEADTAYIMTSQIWLTAPPTTPKLLDIEYA
jgi:hypothetical protein